MTNLQHFLLTCPEVPHGFFASEESWQKQFEKFKKALRQYWIEQGKKVEW